MATLTADRHLAQRSLLDPHEEEHRAPRTRPGPHQDRAQRLPRPQDTARFRHTPSGPTLDDLVAGTWDALTITHAAACPLCGGDLMPRFSSGPQPVAASCRSCGTQIS